MTTQRLTFIGLESFWWASLILLCFLVAVGLIIRIYRYERKLVSRPVGWGLITLRLCVLLLILLMALQPTLSWTSNKKEQTNILVALDVSDSMGLVDEQADETERAQWAVGLGMIRPEMLDESIAEAEKKKGISSFEDKSGRKTDAGGEDTEGQAVEGGSVQPNRDASPDDGQTDNGQSTDGSESTQLEQLAASWNDLSRFELARQLITAPKIGLLDRLDKISTSQLLIFSKKTREMAGDELIGDRDILSSQLVPQATSLTAALQDAAAREKCTAVVLITDGVNTDGKNPLEVANRLSGISRPVFSILAGSIQQPVDLAIESIDHPETVYKKDQPLIRVRLATFGYEGQPLIVSLTDVSTGDRLTKQVRGAERYLDVEFDLPLETPGRQRFIVEVQPKDSQARHELQLENNQQEFGISVIDDTSHVLLVDGEGRWEFRFLEAAYHRDDRVDLKAVLFEQPYLGLLPHTFFESSLPKTSARGNAFEDLDLVIWGDADSRSVDQNRWEDLEKFIAEKGGTLVVTAGKQHFSDLMLNPIMKKMLPIENYRQLESAGKDIEESPQMRGFHLQLTPQGKQHPLMRLDTDSQKNSEMWRRLPGHFWGIEGVAKPGAMVLAKSVGVHSISKQSDQSGVVIVQNYGLGRVLWIGVDSTWRWRFRRGDKDHYRFWGQLSRWAAEMRSSAGSDDVRFGTEATEIQVGEETTARARWSRRVTQNLDEIHATVEVYPADELQTEPIMSFPLRPLETEPLLHEAKIPPLPVGDYRLRLKAAEVPLGPTPIEAKLFVTPRRNGETNRLSADRSLLDQFAAITGGAVFLPHQLDELMKRLNPETLVLEEKHDIPLWNHWIIFVMIVTVLAGEWLLRKWYGLP